MPELINKSVAYKALKQKSEKYEMFFTKDAYTNSARIIDQMCGIMIDESVLCECIQMLGVMQDSLLPCDYVGNDSTIIDGITLESADFVLTTVIRILKGVKENACMQM